MKHNPIISLAVVGLLIVSLAGQAMASFKMACQGTRSCCCRNARAMPDMGGDMAPMRSSCCEASPAQTCDLAGPLASPSIPFRPSIKTLGPEFAMTLAGVLSTISGGASDGVGAIKIPRPPSLAGPPTYLLTQTFLC